MDMRTVQRDLFRTGCRHGELGRVVHELQFMRCEHSRWKARIQHDFISSVQSSSCGVDGTGRGRTPYP